MSRSSRSEFIRDPTYKCWVTPLVALAANPTYDFLRYKDVMIVYPTRKHVSKETYFERCFGGESWQLIADLISGRRAILFLPGSLAVGAVGFLIVIPASSIFILLSMTLFKNATPAFIGISMMVSGFVFVVTHSIFMALVILGLIYAQQDLVRYLTALKIFTLICLVYGFVVAAPFFVLIYSAVGFLTATFMAHLSRSLSFTLYADLMRIKRLYYRHKKAQTRK